MPCGDPYPYPQHVCGCTLPYQQCCGRLVQQQAPHGCICPPGAEATCQGFGCPRKNPFVQMGAAMQSTGEAP